MKNFKLDQSNSKDQIVGNKIILYDTFGPGPKTLKKVEIITPKGDRKKYTIKRTTKGGYLLN